MEDWVDRRFSRQALLKYAGAGAVSFTVADLAGVFSAPAHAAVRRSEATTLNVLCWEGYTDKAFATPFQKKTGIKINSTFIGSNDELIAKLRAAPELYDLVTPSSDTTPLLIEAGAVQRIDTSKVPNWKTVQPYFKTAPNVDVGGKLYGVPMCWGFIPVIADLTAIPKPAHTWAILWDPTYKGEISIWQDISTIWSTALLLGYKNLYTLSDAQLAAVKKKLLEQKPLLRKYWSTAGELTNLFLNHEVVVGNSFGGLTVTQLRENGRKVEEFIPKEGATAWVDNWMISKQSKNLDAAYQWLNWIHAPHTQVQIAKVTGYGVSNRNALKLLPKSYAKTYHLNESNFIPKLTFWKKVPRRQKYLDTLNAVVAG